MSHTQRQGYRWGIHKPETFKEQIIVTNINTVSYSSNARWRHTVCHTRMLGPKYMQSVFIKFVYLAIKSITGVIHYPTSCPICADHRSQQHPYLHHPHRRWWAKADHLCPLLLSICSCLWSACGQLLWWTAWHGLPGPWCFGLHRISVAETKWKTLALHCMGRDSVFSLQTCWAKLLKPSSLHWIYKINR